MKQLKKQEVPTIEERNILLRSWVKAHDLLNLAALCRRVDYDRGSFSHWVEAHHELSEDVIIRIEQALSDYGYKLVI